MQVKMRAMVVGIFCKQMHECMCVQVITTRRSLNLNNTLTQYFKSTVALTFDLQKLFILARGLCLCKTLFKSIHRFSRYILLTDQTDTYTGTSVSRLKRTDQLLSAGLNKPADSCQQLHVLILGFVNCGLVVR